jgi:phytoene dehydrogenase-like protein
MNRDYQVVIVGAGLAGLACGLHLKKKNIPFIILESADAPGGRIRTDEVDGFLLDRGFQILLTEYPEARNIFDYEKLDLKPFSPGALVRLGKKFHRVTDPFREPDKALETLFAPIGTLTDKMNIAKIRLTLLGQSEEKILTATEYTTMELLKLQGFSQSIIDKFFRPFFGGIFLESKLETSSRKFEFFFRTFSRGDNVVPAKGMQELPNQLAEKLGLSNIKLNTRVTNITNHTVTTEDRETYEAPHVVIATDRRAMGKILYGTDLSEDDRSVTCLYFACDTPPIKEPILVLNGEKTGPINNLCVLSNVSSDYAPPGQALVSVTVLGTRKDHDALEKSVRSQLEEWFGRDVNGWRRLRTYRIDNALPKQNPPTSFVENKNEVRPGIYVCGDHMSTGSTNGALQSGREVAAMIEKSLLSTSVSNGAPADEN